MAKQKGPGNPNIIEAGKNTQFSADNQPENRGRKGKAISQFLRDIGQAKKVSFTVRTTRVTGTGEEKDTVKDVEKITIGGNTSSLNELLAMKLFAAALNGDKKALRELIDRTEGRPKQTIDFVPDGDDDTEISINIKRNKKTEDDDSEPE